MNKWQIRDQTLCLLIPPPTLLLYFFPFHDDSSRIICQSVAELFSPDPGPLFLDSAHKVDMPHTLMPFVGADHLTLKCVKVNYFVHFLWELCNGCLATLVFT